jgi:predicted enzyme related to lactoylglutathione lyase
MDPVIHFEVPADHLARAEAFYQRAFGWQTLALGPDGGDFVLAFTAPSDPATRIPNVRGAINGGFYRRTAATQGIQVTILVDDINDTIERIKAAGGEVVSEPYELPGIGLFATFHDTEGNLVQVNQDFAVKRLPEGSDTRPLGGPK